ncbi:hypothetical protein BJY52DRAFT_811511 [Lactarius psammicola]|nr:hypothetical protein BJY52DRAFT_811511 [Lactarius psammicola]
MSAPPLIPPNIAEIAAPLLLGAVWNWTLYGVLVVQTYVYGYNFPNDGTPLKLLVYAIFLIETLQTALSGSDVYHWFVSGFGNLERLTSPQLSALDVPIIGSIVSLVVQFFFVYRIWVLSGRSSRFLCLVICIVSTVDAAAAFGGGVYAQIHGRFASGRTLKILALTWLGGNTLSDLVITVSMVYYLGKRRADGYFSDHALSRIVRLAVETNIMTTTVGLVALLMVSIYSDKNWYTCPTAVIGKLYSNTLLLSLNNRISLRNAPVRGAGADSSAVTVPITSRPGIPSGIVHVQLEKPSAAFVVRPSVDSGGTRVYDIA